MEEHIIGVARKLFTEKGYTNTNMSDIAATAGIKRSTLHYYFRTKDRLFQAIYGDIVRKIIPRIQTILTQNIPFFERMNDIIDEYIALFLSDPALPRFILGEIQRDMGHLVKISQELQIDEYISNIREILADEARKGKIRNVPHRIIFLTLYSQMLFPFLTKNLVITLILQDNEQFADFLQEWKQNILLQMRYLLEPNHSGNTLQPNPKSAFS